MDVEAYQKSFFVQPSPTPRYQFLGSFGVTLYYEDYEAVIDFYSAVLGPPAYVEGEGTRGWPIGDGWLTLLRGSAGGPRNVEVTLQMATPQEAERLQGAFIAAGGTGTPPVDTLMYQPIRACAASDPFGTDFMIISPLDEG